MKKYIILAVVALLGFTSCELSPDGAINYNGPNRVITRSVRENLSIVLDLSKYAILADAVFYGDEAQQKIVKSKLFNDKKVEYKNNTLYIYHNNYYNIVTIDAQTADNVALKLERVYDGVKSHTVNFYTVDGVERCYKIDNYQVLHTQNTVFNNYISYEVAESGVVSKLWGSGVINSQNGDYTLSFSIDESKHIVTTNGSINSYDSGVIDIKYKDLIDNKNLNFLTRFDKGQEYYYK